MGVVTCAHATPIFVSRLYTNKPAVCIKTDRKIEQCCFVDNKHSMLY